MSRSGRAPADLRILIFESLSEDESGGIRNYNTSKLPDGAKAYVQSTLNTYVFRRNSVVDEYDVYVLAPASGGPGRWFLESDLLGGLFSAQLRLVDPTSVGATDDTWTATGGGGDYSLSTNGPLFSIDTDADDGIVTYLGPTGCTFVICAMFSMAWGGEDVPALLEGSISRTGAVILGTTTNSTIAGKAHSDATVTVNIAMFARVSLSTDDTFQGVFRARSPGGSVNVNSYSLTIAKA